jgi:hypothetical protein
LLTELGFYDVRSLFRPFDLYCWRSLFGDT